jgi:hypothetical protein
MSVTRPYPLPNALAHADWVLRALESGGFDASTRLQLHIILHAFIQGLAVNLETELEAASETGVSEETWMETEVSQFGALAASGRFPAFARVLSELRGRFDLDMERLFELGLTSLLSGFESMVRRVATMQPLRGGTLTVADATAAEREPRRRKRRTNRRRDSGRGE